MELSIVLPTYDRPDYLKVAVPNLLEQFSTFHYELIIVDIGSSKDTLEYLESVIQEHKTVRLLRQEKPEGAGRGLQARPSRAVYRCRGSPAGRG